MKHGVINVGCVRGNRVVYVSYTLGHGLAASRRSFADAPIGPWPNIKFYQIRVEVGSCGSY